MTSTQPIVSVRPLAGRRFEPKNELLLLPAAIRAAERRLMGPAKRLWFVTEMKAPYGIPDLVAILGSEEQFERRRLCNVPPLLNQVDAGIVASIGSRASTIEEICARTGWEPSTIARRLPGLLKTEAATVNRAGSVLRNPAITLWGKATAVEMKINDWKRALGQCRKYLSWAETYLLVMDQAPTDRSSEFVCGIRSDRAGLVVDERWIIRPRPKAQTPQRRLWTCEHALSALNAAPTSRL